MTNQKNFVKGVHYIGVGVGAVISNDEGKLFLSKRGQKARNEKGTWEFPGGGLEFGDNFEETLIREMKEEFGIDIEVDSQLEAYNHLIPAENQHWVAIAFMCKIKSGTPKILEPEKCEAIGWFSTDEVKSLPLSLVSQDRLDQILERLDKK